jgi:hypothetical protein
VLISDALEKWHRYSLPSFTERMKMRLRNHCQEDHQSWPAKAVTSAPPLKPVAGGCMRVPPTLMLLYSLRHQTGTCTRPDRSPRSSRATACDPASSCRPWRTWQESGRPGRRTRNAKSNPCGLVFPRASVLPHLGHCPLMRFARNQPSLHRIAGRLPVTRIVV